MRDRLQRRVIPRLVVALSTVTRPARARAALRRMLGRPGRVELYVAVDDPASAVAFVDLTERLRGRRVELDVRPVVERGIPGDPAVEAKRAYALVDARRLAARRGAALEECVEALQAAAGAGDVRRNERRMRRRGAYDTPAAAVGGRWYFAHERGPQIAAWLDELGWT
jgi:hypothetical protein